MKMGEREIEDHEVERQLNLEEDVSNVKNSWFVYQTSQNGGIEKPSDLAMSAIKLATAVQNN